MSDETVFEDENRHEAFLANYYERMSEEYYASDFYANLGDDEDEDNYVEPDEQLADHGARYPL